MGFFKKFFSSRPVDLSEDIVSDSSLEVNLSIVSLKEALKLDGWNRYSNKYITEDEYFVSARLFSATDPQVDLGTSISNVGDYVSVSIDGATIFDKETFEDSYILVNQFI